MVLDIILILVGVIAVYVVLAFVIAIIIYTIEMVFGKEERKKAKKKEEEQKKKSNLSYLDFKYLEFFSNYLEESNDLGQWFDEGHSKFYVYNSENNYAITFELCPRWKTMVIYFLNSKVPKKEMESFESREKYSKANSIHKIELKETDEYYQLIRRYHLLAEEKEKEEFLIEKSINDNKTNGDS
jgi:hypothetical protein